MVQVLGESMFLIFRRFAGICGLLVVAALSFTHPVRATEGTRTYTLSPYDTVQIRIGSWNLTEAAFVPWNGMSGEYRVGADGLLSIPFAGVVDAAGRTSQEISEEIAQRLQSGIGLADRPAVAIEIARYGPIFVSGDVSRPGEFEFRPGMTVQQALAMAGGGSETQPGGPLRTDRNLLQAFGERGQLLERQGRLMLRIARLEAEITGSGGIELPTAMPSIVELDEAIALEEQIMESNRKALDAQLTSVDELEALLVSQIAKLDEQMALLVEQIARAESDLADQQTLIKKGLSVARVESAAARTVATLKLQEIELLVEKLAAEQDLNAAQRERTDITNQRVSERLAELDTARRDVNELGFQIATQSALFAEAYRAGSAAPELASFVPQTITITRRGGDAAGPIPATLTTELESGDTVHVEAAPLLQAGAPAQ